MKRLIVVIVVAAVLVAGIALFFVLRTPSTPPQAVLPNPNGYDDFAAAAQWLVAPGGDLLKLPPEGIRTALNQNSKALETIHSGLKKQSAVPVTNDMNWFNVNMVNVGAHKSMAQLLVAEGIIHLEEGRTNEAARAFADTNPANNAGADEDLARLMLRSLLIEKFQIKWHMEDRPMPAFAIVADSPKMTKGDPTKRTRCYEGLPAGSPAAAKPPQFPRLFTCENVSMQQFGQLLPQIASNYTRVNALDKTGLQGGFDFTLNWSPIGQVQGPQPEAGAANTGAALDPTGALSLQDAVRRQLGIRLEDTKLPVPVLVIDSISEKPLDN